MKEEGGVDYFFKPGSCSPLGSAAFFFITPLSVTTSEYRKTRAACTHSQSSSAVPTMEFPFNGSRDAFHLPDRGSSS